MLTEKPILTKEELLARAARPAEEAMRLHPFYRGKIETALKARVRDFELVLRSRFPSVHDTRTRPWGKTLGRLLAARRWRTGRYDNPWLLRAVRRWAGGLDHRQAYGHLRPARDESRA